MAQIRLRQPYTALCCVVLLLIFGLWFLFPTGSYLPGDGIASRIHEMKTFEKFRNGWHRWSGAGGSHRKPTKHIYPRRQNMEPCKPVYGKVGVFVAVDTKHSKTLYKIAQASLKCYLKSTNYQYFFVNVDNDEKTAGKCNQTNMLYRRHCIASYYLQEVDWLLVLDGDVGVVNPEHCIEEWIDDRVDLLFYERFFNWEIMAGSYMVRNTPLARKFLMEWANMNYEEFDGFTGYDNGALQIVILKYAIPSAHAEIKACDRIYKRAKTLEQYYNYVTCVKLMLGAVRIYPGSLRIYRRAHGWARDSQLAGNRWSEQDFMFHAWKANELNSTWFDANVFETIPNPEECGNNLNGWKWLSEKKTTLQEIQGYLSRYEEGIARGYPKEGRDLPHLIEPDTRECYPNCEKDT